MLHQHCQSAGRDPGSVLKTALVGLVLGHSPEAARAKLAALPPFVGFFERLPIVGTAEESAVRLRALVEAGFQYIILMVFDPQSLQLAAEQVIPAVLAD